MKLKVPTEMLPLSPRRMFWIPSDVGQGTVPCPILDFIQGAGKIIPRALVVGFNWAFHRGTENRPLSHALVILEVQSKTEETFPCLQIVTL